MNIQLFHGDCRDAVRGLPLVDAVVTDPPYHLTNTNRGRRGFMGQEWDGGDVAFDPETWIAIGEAMKPGAHLVVFGGSRTFYRVWCAVEDAGFEVRDTLLWLYGSGFPKSLDVSKAIDKHLGVEGVSSEGASGKGAPTVSSYAPGLNVGFAARPKYTPAGDEAIQWQGWGSALKPAFEPILLARKPLAETSIACNVLVHGTGAVNVDGCRVATVKDLNGGAYAKETRTTGVPGSMAGPLPNAIGREFTQPAGRFPANIMHDGSDEVLALFPETGPAKAGARGGTNPNPMDWGNGRTDGAIVKDHTDSGGSAARFFPTLDYGPEDEEFVRGLYCPKAGKTDREGSKHPTVKPQKLMRWLCRLVTPPGGTVLDPFAGSGATLKAATSEGFSAIGCDITDEWIAEMEKRFDVEAELTAEFAMR